MKFLSYGVDTSTFQTLFDLIWRLGRRIGVHIEAGQPSKTHIIMALLYKLPSVSMDILDLNHIITIERRVEGIRYLILQFGSWLNVLPKLLILILKSDAIHSLAMSVQRNAKANSLDKQEQLILQKYVRRAKITSNIMLSSLTAVVVCLAALPVVMSWIFPVWLNPLQIEIPGLNPHAHPGYDLNMLVCNVYIIHGVFVYATFDSLFFNFVLFIMYELELFKSRVVRLGDSRLSQSENSQLLHEVVELQVNIFSFYKKFAGIFEPFIIFQVAFVTLCLAVCLMALDNEPLFIGQVIQVLLLQFLIFALFGQLLTAKAYEASVSIYEAKWYNLRNRSDCRIFLIMLMQSQKPLTLKPFRIVELSLETFVKVLKASFSFYTFLNNVI